MKLTLLLTMALLVAAAAALVNSPVVAQIKEKALAPTKDDILARAKQEGKLGVARGLKIIDDHWPFGASLLTPGSLQEDITRGKKLSIIDWNHYTKLDDYLQKIVKVIGSPKASVK